jgi:type I restriction enzyme S subunit
MSGVKLRRVATPSVVKDQPGERPNISLEHVVAGGARLVAGEIPVSGAGDSLAFEPGDVLFSKLRPYLAKSLLVAEPLFGSSEFLAMQSDPNSVDPRYLVFVTLSRPWLDWATATSYGTKMPRTSWEQMAEYCLHLPTIDEQRRIADFLDEQVGQLDRSIALRLRQKELLNEARTAALSRCMTGESSASHEHDVLGPISDDTEPTKLIRAVRQIAVGVVVNPSTYFVDEGVPFIHGYNVRDGWLDLTEHKRMLPADSASLPRSRLIGGEVLVVRAGYPGRAAVVPEELAGANCASVLILRCGPTVLPEYLATFFNAPQGRGQVRVGQYGAAQEVISAGQVAEYVIPLVALAEQRQRLSILHSDLESLDRTHALAERHGTLLEERKQALITAAVTGQFDVTTARAVA